MSEIVPALLRFVLIVPCIVFHEVAHGYAAYLLGDDTAKLSGRLTLDPIPHIDLWGTILMPAILLLISGGQFAFGYAKPVPINPARMTRTSMRTGLLLTGIAGPTTNLALAIVGAGVFRLVGGAASVVSLLETGSAAGGVLTYILFYFVFINLVLLFLNLIPIPPLDGSRVVQRFLSGEALRIYEGIERYGFSILLLLLFVLPFATGIDIIGGYLGATVFPVLRFLLGAG